MSRKRKQNIINELADIQRRLLDTLETCHVCHGSLHLEDVEPTHCEDCSVDCEDHKGPPCEPLYATLLRAQRALYAIKERLA